LLSPSAGTYRMMLSPSAGTDRIPTKCS
jgi:hypothetical protein